MALKTLGAMTRIRKQLINDTLAAGATLETAATTEADIVNGLASQFKRLSGEANWHTAPVASLSALNTNVTALESKKRLYFTDFVTDITNGLDNSLVLNAPNFPTGTIAKGAVTTTGIVCANGNTAINAANLVAGLNAVSPKNRCLIRDAATGDPIFAAATGNEIFGLLVASAANGTGVGDGILAIHFAEMNAAKDGVVAAQNSDVSGIVFNYSYPIRELEANIPEDAHLTSNFVDSVAAVDVTLGNAYANQVGDVTQAANININIADAKVWELFDSTGLNSLLQVAPNVAGDVLALGGNETQVNSPLFNVNATTNAFSAGVTVGSGGANAIDLGATTAGEILSVGAVRLRGGTTTELDDANRTGSGWASSGVKLSASQQEWIDAKAAFGGEFSVLKMAVAAKNSSAYSKTSAFPTGAIAQEANVSFGVNLSAQLGDYSGVASFKDQVSIHLDGKMMIGGNAAGANIDVYPGTNPANGDLKFYDGLDANDVIIMEIHG